MSLKRNVEPFCTFFKVSVRERMDDGLWHEMMKKVIKELSLSISLKMPWHLISGLAKLVPFSSLRGEGVMCSFANEGCGGMRGRPWKPLNKKSPGRSFSQLCRKEASWVGVA